MDEINAGVKRTPRWWTEWNLENWARVLKSGGEPDGLPEAASVGENYTSLDLYNEDAYLHMERELADLTSIVVSGLPEAERQALRHRYLGENYDWDHLSLPYGIALALAIPLVTEGLRRRGVWLGD